MNGTPSYLAIDIGAGFGAKIGLFTDQMELVGETLVSKDDYGQNALSMTEAVGKAIDGFLSSNHTGAKNVRAIGIASPGLFRSDGSYLLAANLKFLNNQNLPELFGKRFGIPVGIENDANAGGLAEWSVMQTELFYWVFGGGWGGAWISADGNVRYPALDWDGRDASLHYTNEPGYAIPLDKLKLKMLFAEVGGSYERFEQLLIDETHPAGGVISGPSGSPDHIRAEVILSGPGRCRLFRAIVGDDDFYKQFLNITEINAIMDPSVAGPYISKLSRLRVESAVNSDRLFGKVLAEAARLLIKQAVRDGAPESLPICLGGKPSYALPYFGPSTQRALGKMGFMSYMRPSVIDERGSNANLVGACVVARKAWEKSRG